MPADHYLQAAFLGARWGEPSRECTRYWKLQHRPKHKATAEKVRANKVARQNRLYLDWLERFWTVYEGDLPRVASELEQGQLVEGDEQFLLLHVAALRARSPFFQEFYREYQHEQNLSTLGQQDDLSVERIKSLLATIPYATTWRWRVLHAPTNETFVINDSGCCQFSDHTWPGSGIFFPLGSGVGILGFLHRPERHRRLFRQLDFSEHLTLNRGYATLLNVRSWEQATRFVIGRYDQQTMIEGLHDGQDASVGLAGPYRFRGFGFFDD